MDLGDNIFLEGQKNLLSEKSEKLLQTVASDSLFSDPALAGELVCHPLLQTTASPISAGR